MQVDLKILFKAPKQRILNFFGIKQIYASKPLLF